MNEKRYETVINYSLTGNLKTYLNKDLTIRFYQKLYIMDPTMVVKEQDLFNK